MTLRMVWTVSPLCTSAKNLYNEQSICMPLLYSYCVHFLFINILCFMCWYFSGDPPYKSGYHCAHYFFYFRATIFSYLTNFWTCIFFTFWNTYQFYIVSSYNLLLFILLFNFNPPHIFLHSSKNFSLVP